METWVLLTFASSIAAGALLVVGIAVGVADLEAHSDGHLELGGDHGHDALSLFGWGRTPFLVSLTTILLLFGSLGFVGVWFGLSGQLAVPVAALGTYGVGRWLTRGLARWLPSLETASARRHDFIGRAATVILPAKPGTLGLIQLSFENDLYQFSYRHTGRVEFERGDHVVVADMDPQTRICTVMDDPTRWGGLT